MNRAAWKFEDTPNLAVLTTSPVASGVDWIAYVSHDADDGGWQFHGTQTPTVENGAVLGLGEVVALDPSIAELHDLPLGWNASRLSPDGKWERQPG